MTPQVATGRCPQALSRLRSAQTQRRIRQREPSLLNALTARQRPDTQDRLNRPRIRRVVDHDGVHAARDVGQADHASCGLCSAPLRQRRCAAAAPGGGRSHLPWIRTLTFLTRGSGTAAGRASRTSSVLTHAAPDPSTTTWGSPPEPEPEPPLPPVPPVPPVPPLDPEPEPDPGMVMVIGTVMVIGVPLTVTVTVVVVGVELVIVTGPVTTGVADEPGGP